MKKKTNLESGFLFLYDWMPVLEALPAKEVKALLLALIARQRENQPLPSFRNPLTQSFARMIEPVICRRLEGAAWAKKGLTGQDDPSGVPMGEPAEPERDERSKEENSKDELSKAEPAERRGAREAEPPSPPATSRELSEQERCLLFREGLPSAYVKAREERASEFARQSGQDISAVLRNWWKQDKRSFLAAQKREEERAKCSFDADDFFEAALNRPLWFNKEERSEDVS